MKERKLQPQPETARQILMAERDKAVDESMASLISWLTAAQGKGLLTQDKAKEILKEELKDRFGYDS